MTEIDISKVLIEGDYATIMGVKYQRIVKPQSFYDKLWGLLKTKLGDRDCCSGNHIMFRVPKTDDCLCSICVSGLK